MGSATAGLGAPIPRNGTNTNICALKEQQMDIVERLRRLEGDIRRGYGIPYSRAEAIASGADEIERLRAALLQIVQPSITHPDIMKHIASNALTAAMGTTDGNESERSQSARDKATRGTDRVPHRTRWPSLG